MDDQKGSEQIRIFKMVVVGIGGQRRVHGNFEHGLNLSDWGCFVKPVKPFFDNGTITIPACLLLDNDCLLLYNTCLALAGGTGFLH